MIIDENRRLGEGERRRVLERVRRRRLRCESCGSEDFEVGEALYLGFLFLDEATDAYMVALTCKNPCCAGPRTGIRLHGVEFLEKAAKHDR